MTQYDPLDQRGQAEAKAEASKSRQFDALQHSDDVKWFMGDPRGRRLMRSWLTFCGVDRTPFTGDDSQTMFRCGGQNVGLMLKAQITEHAMEGYFQMLREHLSESSNEGSAHIEG